MRLSGRFIRFDFLNLPLMPRLLGDISMGLRDRPGPTRDPNVFPEELRRTLIVSESARGVTAPVESAQPRRLAVPAVVTGLLVVAAVLFCVVLSMQQWSGPHLSPLAISLLDIRIVDGALPVIVDGLAFLALIFLLARRLTPRRGLVGAAAMGGGAGIALLVLWIVSSTNALGVQLSTTTSIWVTVTFAAMALAIASFWSARWLRRVGIILCFLVILLTGTIGVNADFGLNPTVGDFVGISTQKTLTLPLATPKPTPSATRWCSRVALSGRTGIDPPGCRRRDPQVRSSCPTPCRISRRGPQASTCLRLRWWITHRRSRWWS